MRVLTRNVFRRWGGDWRERAPAILATLREHEPDVVGAGDRRHERRRRGRCDRPADRRALIDTWRAGGGDPAARTLDSGVPHVPVEVAHLIDRRIDHVFARPGTPGAPVRVDRAFLAGDEPVGGV